LADEGRVLVEHAFGDLRVAIRGNKSA
jgi:hypothetical protein